MKSVIGKVETCSLTSSSIKNLPDTVSKGFFEV